MMTLLRLCLSSFDSFGFASAMTRGSVGGRDGGTAGADAGTQVGGGGGGGGAELTPSGGRRNSFLYRSTDSITDISPMSLSRKLSAASGEVSVLVQSVVLPFCTASRDLM